jgi:gas vesicle protein
MDNKEIIKQMIDFHKTTFENCFSTMNMVQGQAEKLLKAFVDRTPGLSDEHKKIMNQWSESYKKGIEYFKKAMDEGYVKMGQFLDSHFMDAFQEQTEKMFNSYLNQINWIPPDLKKTIDEFASTYKKGCEEFKKYVDENIWRIQNFSPNVKKTRTTKKK